MTVMRRLPSQEDGADRRRSHRFQKSVWGPRWRVVLIVGTGRRLERTGMSMKALTGVDGARPARIALFSGNYNYTLDGANKSLNRLVGHLQDTLGATVR